MAGMMPTYDYETEQANLLRRLKVAEAMQQGGLAPLGPTEMVGGVAVKQSPLQGLAKLAQTWMASKNIQALEDEQKQLAGRYKADLRSGVSDLIEGLSSQPGQTIPEQQGNNPSAYVPAHTLDAGDAQAAKRNAILNAIGSGNPMLQQIGMSYLTSMQKDQVLPKDLLPYVDPKSIPGLLKYGSAAFTPKPPKLQTVGDTVFDPDQRKVVTLDGPQPDTVRIDGDLYQRSPSTGQLKKLDNAPKITNNIKVPVNVKGEGKFMEKIGELSAEDLTKVKQARVSAQRTIQSMQKLEQLDRQGVFSGPGATIAMTVGSLAEAMGVPVDKQKLANSQAYQGELMSNLTNVLTGSLARSTTDKDVQILQQPLPQLLNSPEGRAALRRQAVAKAQEQIQYADQVQERLKSDFPDAARLIDLTPGTTDVPQRADVLPPDRANKFRVIR